MWFVMSVVLLSKKIIVKEELNQVHHGWGVFLLGTQGNTLAAPLTIKVDLSGPEQLNRRDLLTLRLICALQSTSAPHPWHSARQCVHHSQAPGLFCQYLLNNSTTYRPTKNWNICWTQLSLFNYRLQGRDECKRSRSQVRRRIVLEKGRNSVYSWESDLLVNFLTIEPESQLSPESFKRRLTEWHSRLI